MLHSPPFSLAYFLLLLCSNQHLPRLPYKSLCQFWLQWDQHLCWFRPGSHKTIHHPQTESSSFSSTPIISFPVWHPNCTFLSGPTLNTHQNLIWVTCRQLCWTPCPSFPLPTSHQSSGLFKGYFHQLLCTLFFGQQTYRAWTRTLQPQHQEGWLHRGLSPPLGPWRPFRSEVKWFV